MEPTVRGGLRPVLPLSVIAKLKAAKLPCNRWQVAPDGSLSLANRLCLK